MNARATGPVVLVTDAGRGSSLAIIRSLGQAGWRVIAADSDAGSIGFRSRFASKRLVVPSPSLRQADYVEELSAAVQRERVDLVIPVTDASMLPLARERARLANACRVAMPEPEALLAVTDKRRTLELATELGVPVPMSVLVETPEEARRAAAQFGWPVVLKPKSSRIAQEGGSIEAFEVSYASTLEEVSARLAQLGGRCPILVQEYCAGIGRGVGLLTHEGRPLAAFQHRRLHEVPITGGASSLRMSEALDPGLYAHSVRLLERLRWTGLALVEFKDGPRGVRLMEINGRVWGSLPLAVMSGVDFPRLLAELYLYGPPPADTPPLTHYRIGVRARNLALDMVWFGSALTGRRRIPLVPAPSRSSAISELFGLLDPRCHLDIQSWSDPIPGLAELPRIFAQLARKAREFVASN